MTDASDYDYPLPRERIAQFPASRRSDSRLMLVDRSRQAIEHRAMRELPRLLAAGDCLVLNDTRVVPARLVGRRVKTGGFWEGLFLDEQAPGIWRLLCKTRGKLAPGDEITLANNEGRDDVRLVLLERGAGGAWTAAVQPQGDEPPETWPLLERVGRVPLPHYIRRGQMVEADRRRYQTVYARRPGSVAAPTAGLHLTHEMLSELLDAGLALCRVTLHVGPGTFRPIAAASLEEHRMHSEWRQVDESAAAQIRDCRARGGRVVAVGTTSVRTLESAVVDGEVRACSGPTDLFIRPGYAFQVVDALLTNFHLPRSTLLVLVRTFGGDALIRRAYEEAIARDYRFYSYGDAMLIV